jgi:hypothetical protein
MSDPRPGTYIESAEADFVPDVVEVRHPELKVTQLVRKDRLGQMDPAWEVVTEAATDLKGKALDAALDEAGLSTSGSAEDKRARLAEHQAASVSNLDVAADENKE